ncbi:hypothetical protein D3C71_1422140 [compost metagenome]
MRQRHEGIAGVDGGTAAVHFVHATAANGTAQGTGFLFQLVFDGQHALLHHQLVIGGVDIAIQIQELECRGAMHGVFVVEDRTMLFTGLVTNNQLVSADGKR